nr:PREDICTED: catenin delta-2 isoform X3 [Bemisia tabaci]
MADNSLTNACLLVNRRVEQMQEHRFTCTEITQRRVVKDKNPDMPQYMGHPEIAQSSSYSVDVSYHPANGHPGSHSPNSSLQSEENPTLVSRTQKQQTTQQITTVTKVIREVHHMGPDGEAPPVDYVAFAAPPGSTQEHMLPQNSGRHYGEQYGPTYHDYDHFPPQGNLSVSGLYSSSVGCYQPYGNTPNYAEQPPTPPSPSERSESPPPAHGVPYLPSGYDELDATHMLQRPEHFRITPSPGDVSDRYGMRWRDPNLTEVISFLSNPNNLIKANAAAYLQHLCYMDDPNKQKTRSLGGIPPLVKLLNNENPDVYRNACGALRNLSYGRQNDENKRAIKTAGGIPLLINLLRKSIDAEVKELVTGVLWNLSSCEDLKRCIIDDGLGVIVNHVIIPHSGWDPVNPGETLWSTVFRNTTGVLRNVSSAGEYARKKLRECEGLVDALLYVVKSAVEKSNIGNKSVENCVCILRNLSYRCQEVEDPNYDKHPLVPQNKVSPQSKEANSKLISGDNLGCFGGSKKKKEAEANDQRETSVTNPNLLPKSGPVKGLALLWQPEVVPLYLALLQSCSNPETLEAAAGALQNLAACYWQPSIEIRAAVRKEKGLPILVELLRMEVDRFVCAIATALRNLAIDQRNKELIGKYAMRDLVQKLPSGNPQHDHGTSDDTIAAVLATLNEVIKKNAEFSRSLLEAGGVERLMNITRQRQKYTPRVLKFAGQVLFTMWQHQELREVYKKHNWKEQDFVTKTIAARNAGPNSPSNASSTLNRPMASQGGTRYEDRTIQRPTTAQNSDHSMGNNIAGPSNPAVVKPGEPLYAQVNREKKKNRQFDGNLVQGSGEVWAYEENQVKDAVTPSGGDSWV